MEIAVCHSETHYRYLCPHIFTCKCSMQRVISLVEASVLYYTIDSGSSRDSSGYPVVALCCGYPAALGLQIRFLRMLQQIIDRVHLGTDQGITLDLAYAAVGLIYQIRNRDSSIMFPTLGLAPVYLY